MKYCIYFVNDSYYLKLLQQNILLPLQKQMTNVDKFTYIIFDFRFCRILWQMNRLEKLSALEPATETPCRRKMCVRDSNRMLGRKNCAPTVFVRKRSIPKNPNEYTLTTNHCRKYLQLRFGFFCNSLSN